MKLIMLIALTTFATPVWAESLSATLSTIVASPCPPAAKWATEEAELATLLVQIKQGIKIAERKRKASETQNMKDIWAAFATEAKNAEKQLTARIAKCG